VTTPELCGVKMTTHLCSKTYAEKCFCFRPAAHQLPHYSCLFPSSSITVTTLQLKKFPDNLLIKIQQLILLDFHKLTFLSVGLATGINKLLISEQYVADETPLFQFINLTPPTPAITQPPEPDSLPSQSPPDDIQTIPLHTTTREATRLQLTTKTIP
jgi:hypothetical protein